jgi:hypothetical protein
LRKLITKLFLSVCLLAFVNANAQTLVYATSQTNGANGLCLFCSVINPANATDTSNSTYSKLNLTVGALGADVYQDVAFTSAASAGKYVSAIVEDDNLGLLSASILGSLQISTALGGIGNGDNHNGASVSISLLAGSTTKYVISFLACCGFDQVHIQLNAGIVSAVTKLRVYSVSYDVKPLPIELLYFTASYNKHTVSLNWATATEHNNDYYTIERTIDGINYEVVSIKKGAGDSRIKLVYSDQDNNPKQGVSYYRLKQTDYDGKFQYSSIAQVSNNEDIVEISSKIIDRGQICISVKGVDVNGSTTISIYNILGTLVYSTTIESSNTSAEITPNKSFDTGIYFVIASTNKSILKQKKIIVN